MRWLFLFMFSLNLAYVAWEVSKSSDGEYTEVAALKSVKSVVLLSELKARQAIPEQVVTSLQVEDTLAEGADKSAKKQDDPQLASSDTVKSVNVDTASVPASTPVATKKSEVSVKPAVQPKKSMLQTKAKDTDSAAVVVQKPLPVASCYTLGPFRDLDKLRGLTREVKSYVVKADFRGREEKEQTLYWVYVKPEKNRTQAIATGNRLKAKKINDFYVIRDGDKVNGLSLGHFRSKDGAYGLAKKVTKLGFDVIVEPVFRSYTIYWLDYQLSSGVSIPESIFEQYTKSDSKDKISRLSRDCGT